MLFKKCTIAVKRIEVSIEKNRAKTGRRIVPRPKPEKKVSKEAPNAAKETIKYSIIDFLSEN